MPEKQNSTRTEKKIRMENDTIERVNYWAKAKNISFTEYVNNAVDSAIARENLDFQVPSLLVNRLNELIEAHKKLVLSVENNISRNDMNFDTLISMTRGDNNYLDVESGETR